MVATPQPPPLPAIVFQRVLNIARIDGLSVVCVAFLGTLVAVIAGDPLGGVIGTGVVTAGVIELAGAKALKDGRMGGINALVSSQLMLLLLIWTYVGFRLWLGTDTMTARLLSPERLRQLAELGIDTGLLVDLFQRMLPITYGIIVVATLAYQGGLALFYHRQRATIGLMFK